MKWVTIRPGLDVLVRGWLNANQIVGWQPGQPGQIVDAGYYTHAQATVAALAAHRSARNGYATLYNTHCHSDHMGGNAAIARAFGCSIAVPVGEAQHISPWDPQKLWLEQTGQGAEVFIPERTLQVGEGLQLGPYRFEALAAPGHAMEAMLFWCAAERIVITGDALWEHGTGFVWPQQGDNLYVKAALAALDTIATLAPAIVIPGHGEPFTDVTPAIERARSKLNAFSKDPAKAARYTTKAFFVFNLLEHGAWSIEEARRAYRTFTVHEQLCQTFLATSAEAYFDVMLGSLIAGGAVRRDGQQIVPTMRA
jgi:glyoxylase-like metal-dependent hydrolase (beta-lactamase superfamily II)